MLYRLINLGKTQRREYLHLNRSKLFQSLPCKSLTEEQRESYEYFQKKALPELFKFYFPSQFKDYNNQIRLEILDFRFEEPKFSEVEAYRKKIT
jgi:DNA-directed RNA polymerase beta subunit